MSKRPDEVKQQIAPPLGLVPAVTKAIRVVRYLNDRPSGGSALPEIAEALSIARSHLHNILRTLVAHGWAHYEPASRRYRLSSGIAADSASALASRAHLAAIRPQVDDLAEASGFPCTLCEPIADGSFLIVHTTGEMDPFVFRAPVGYRFPPGTAALFKARIAWLPAAEQRVELERWQPVQHSRFSIVDRGAMSAELVLSRQRGYARSAGEYVEGFTTLALPIFNRDGEVLLILTVAGRDQAIAPHEPQVARRLARAIGVIHRQLDGRPPVDFPAPD
jgi:DNA-binding IclR family transcriptional regulator